MVLCRFAYVARSQMNFAIQCLNELDMAVLVFCCCQKNFNSLRFNVIEQTKHLRLLNFILSLSRCVIHIVHLIDITGGRFKFNTQVVRHIFYKLIYLTCAVALQCVDISKRPF